MRLSHRALARTLTLLVTSLATVAGTLLLAPGSAYAATTTGILPDAAAPVRADLSEGTWPGHPGRRIVTHVVGRGDTATGLAVRYHAWTAELRALNGLRTTSMIRIGQRLRIPVVSAAVRKQASTTASRPSRAMTARGWRNYQLSRAQVRRLIITTAHRYGVAPKLALAVGWQESGWHQPLVSGDGAIGVMQVLPSTGEWMELHADRRLNLRGTRDNITAGVLLLKVLGSETRTTRGQVAAYYQGLGALRGHGLYRDTRQYVASVLALRNKF